MKSKLVVLFRPTAASCVAIQITVDPSSKEKERLRVIRAPDRSNPRAKNGTVSRGRKDAAPAGSGALAPKATLD